jgi:excisionase family DNA binding protein
MTQEIRVTISIDSAALRLGISRKTAFKMAAQGSLPVIRCGQKRMVVPLPAFEAMLRDEWHPKVDSGPSQKSGNARRDH